MYFDENSKVLNIELPQQKYSKNNIFNFVAAGDFSCSGNAEKTIANMKKKDPELLLALGDLSYEKTDNCWTNIIEKNGLKDKTKIVIGYHDINGPDGKNILKQYTNEYDLSKQFYSFNYENVHFIVLGTETNSGKSSNQYKFVREDLEKVNIDNTDWIVVLGYRPLYSAPTEHGGNEDLRDTYHPLFEKYGVDLVLYAHNHNYQRTFPIKYNEDDSSAPEITDNTDKFHKDDGKSIVFVNAGTGGAKLHEFDGKNKMNAKQIKAHGFLNVIVDKSGMKLDLEFIKNSGGKNNIVDRYQIIK